VGGSVEQLVLDLNDLRKYPALLEMLTPRNMPILRYSKALNLRLSLDLTLCDNRSLSVMEG
jgi:hypothetical protein